MNLNLDNKTAFITASSSGIGKAIAEVFLEEGASVIINGRNSENLGAVSYELSQKGGRVLAFAGDSASENDLAGLPGFLRDNGITKIDCLVLNLGSGKPLGGNLDHKEWLRFFEINLFGAVKVLEAISDKITSSIVFISSIAALQTSSAPYGYSAAKLGVISLVKRLSADLAGKGVRVNCVLPGNVYFEGGRWSEILRDDPTGTESFIKNNVPLNRFGTPREIADAVVFLSSERSVFTTGACLVADGGQSAGCGIVL